MRNLKLRTKMLAGFLCVAVITIIVGFLGLYGISTVTEEANEIGKVRLPSVMGLQIINEGQTAVGRVERTLLVPEMYNNEKERTYQLQRGESIWKTIETGFKIYEPLPQTKEEEALWKKFQPAWDAWKKHNKEFFDLMKAGKREEAIALSMGKQRESFLASEKLLGELIELNTRLGNEAVKNAEADGRVMRFLAILGMVIGTAISVILGILLSVKITRPINRVAIGLGDGAEQVAAASSQVASSSQSLAEGTSEQAASLEETSSSLEEIASMTQQNADNATQAKNLMTEAQKIIAKVEDQMNDMGTAILDVTKSSEETGKIIKTIDEIAFQTNLLALNAAVEAARAGDAGAGFAVVADEVRNLAMRAAEAAKNTSSLIENTIVTVKRSRDLTEIAQGAFKENVVISGKVGNLIDEIEVASQEQARGIGQVNTAIAQMDKVVQASAANAEESASASEEMNAQAEQMKTYVNDLMAILGESTHSAATSVSLPSDAVSTVSPSHEISGRNQNGSARPVKKLITTKKAGGRRPEEVIPMETGSFQNF